MKVTRKQRDAAAAMKGQFDAGLKLADIQHNNLKIMLQLSQFQNECRAFANQLTRIMSPYIA